MRKDWQVSKTPETTTTLKLDSFFANAAASETTSRLSLKLHEQKSNHEGVKTVQCRGINQRQ
jgi:hypothetical protein